MLEIKIDCTITLLFKDLHITIICIQSNQDLIAMTRITDSLLVISGKSLFVKILVHRLIVAGIYIIVSWTNIYPTGFAKNPKFATSLAQFLEQSTVLAPPAYSVT